jgi:hypothetical protein
MQSELAEKLKGLLDEVMAQGRERMDVIDAVPIQMC